MKYRSILLLISMIMTWNMAIGQKSLNEYKYVLVQKQYEFQRSMDSYQVNSLLKFLFERAGYIAYFTDERVPEDLMNNPCMAVRAVLKNKPSFLRIKMSIDLLDCSNAVVFSTSEATTKEKDFKKAYHEVIRASFVDIESLNYAYEPKEDTQKEVESVAVKEPEVIEEPIKEVKIEEPVKVVKKEKEKIEASTTEKAVAVVAESKEESEQQAKVVKEKAALKESKTPKQVKEKIAAPPPPKPAKKQVLTGSFDSAKWGRCEIVEDSGNYLLKVGTEKAVFATLYPTSKPTIYIVKWVAYIQPQLAEVTSDGNLRIDAESGVEVYTRVD